MATTVRVLGTDYAVSVGGIGTSPLMYRLAHTPGGPVTLAVVDDAGRAEYEVPVGVAPWLRGLAVPSASDLADVVRRFVEWSNSAPRWFCDRFTEEEWGLFAAGLCCWVTEYGNGGGIKWCREPRMFGQIYCSEHTRDVENDYATYRGEVSVPWERS